MIDALVGTIFGGTYRVEARLGAGGIGAVYRATHLRTRRAYALKVLHTEAAPDESNLTRFKVEAETLARLGHVGLVAIHDFDIDTTGIPFMVMDLLEGEDIDHRLRRLGVFAPADVIRVMEQIASALEAAHSVGIVHRDLKPANVFLAQKPGLGEIAVVLDFGLAKMLADAPDTQHKLTQTGAILGTPMYMSPEQARGEAVDVRTDVYSLACIAFEMLTGTAPFEASTLTALLAHVLTSPAPRLESRGVANAQHVDEVLVRAMSKAPTERFESVRAFVDALRTALDKTPDFHCASDLDALRAKRISHTSAVSSNAPTRAFGKSTPLARVRASDLPATRVSPSRADRTWLFAGMIAGPLLAVGVTLFITRSRPNNATPATPNVTQQVADTVTHNEQTKPLDPPSKPIVVVADVPSVPPNPAPTIPNNVPTAPTRVVRRPITVSPRVTAQPSTSTSTGTTDPTTTTALTPMQRAAADPRVIELDQVTIALAQVRAAVQTVTRDSVGSICNASLTQRLQRVPDNTMDIVQKTVIPMIENLCVEHRDALHLSDELLTNMREIPAWLEAKAVEIEHDDFPRNPEVRAPAAQAVRALRASVLHHPDPRTPFGCDHDVMARTKDFNAFSNSRVRSLVFQSYQRVELVCRELDRRWNRFDSALDTFRTNIRSFQQIPGGIRANIVSQYGVMP